jgi:hypothetical protein
MMDLSIIEAAKVGERNYYGALSYPNLVDSLN